MPSSLALTLAAVCWLLALLMLVALLRQVWVRAAIQRRLAPRAEDEFDTATRRPAAEAAPGSLRRWLALAGFRSPSAPLLFVGSTALVAVGGALAAWLLLTSGLMALADAGVSSIPGGVGDLFRPVIFLAPWLILLLLLATPTLLVRAARRRRVAQVEQDLPVTLELLATLAESGLGFDAAVRRIRDAFPPQRVLASELRTFQADVLAGRGRVECLRRLSRRVDVAALSILVSALVQAEQIGASIADTLRRQADDLRSRRRERANEIAMALPVKLLIPLVVCFLPGIFVYTLGPTFYQFFQYVDAIARVQQF